MLPVFIIGALVLVGGLLTLAVVRGRGSSQTIEDRLNELSAMGQSITLEEIELSRPFSQRVLAPMVAALGQLVQRFTPQNTLETVRHKLALAGIAHKVRPAQFMAYRIGGALILGVSSLLVVFASSVPFGQRLLIIVVAFGLGYLLPGTWLGSKIKKRQDEDHEGDARRARPADHLCRGRIGVRCCHAKGGREVG